MNLGPLLTCFPHVGFSSINFQKVVYIDALGQLLKLGSFFPFKKCKLKNESSGIYFIVD